MQFLQAAVDFAGLLDHVGALQAFYVFWQSAE